MRQYGIARSVADAEAIVPDKEGGGGETEGGTSGGSGGQRENPSG